MAAADLARHHIRVNAVVPGFIATNIFTASLGIAGEAQQRANAMIAAGAAKAQPIQRTGTAEDIAAAIAFLASDDASFITGTSLLVDGGLTIGPRHSWDPDRSEEHTSELQSLMRISYAVFCLKKKNRQN